VNNFIYKSFEGRAKFESWRKSHQNFELIAIDN
jgi:hypothetical protein